VKTITIPPQSTEIAALLDEARQEDVLLRAADGSQYLLTAVDDLDEEIVRTRRNTRLMALLEERAKESQTVSLAEVKRKLQLSD
jgi:hypothetical protein